MPPADWRRNAVKSEEEAKAYSSIQTEFADLFILDTKRTTVIGFHPSRESMTSSPEDWTRNILPDPEDRV